MLVGRREAVTAMEHRVVLTDDRSVGERMLGSLGRRPGSVGPVGVRATGPVVEPADRRGHRHSPVLEQFGSAHGRQQPHRILASSHAAELRDVDMRRPESCALRYLYVHIDLVGAHDDRVVAEQPARRAVEAVVVEQPSGVVAQRLAEAGPVAAIRRADRDALATTGARLGNHLVGDPFARDRRALDGALHHALLERRKRSVGAHQPREVVGIIEDRCEGEWPARFHTAKVLLNSRLRILPEPVRGSSSTNETVFGTL